MSQTPEEQLTQVADNLNAADQKRAAAVAKVADDLKTSIIKEDRRQRLDLDVRGLIGLIAVFGLFGLVFTQLFKGIAVAIPPEVAGVVGSVVGFYFGSRSSGESNGKGH